MKKILFVVNDADFFISHRLPIAKFLIEQNFEVHLATSGQNLEIYDEIGLKFHELNITRKGMKPLYELRLIWQLYKLLSKLKPDLVHLVTIKPYLYGGILTHFVKVPAIVSAISGLGFDFMSEGLKAKCLKAFLYSFYKFAFRHKNQIVIFQNQDDADFLVKWGVVNPSKVSLIKGSGVDLSVHQHIEEPKGKIIVTFVARLLVDKGIREFIDASRILQKKEKKAVFWIVGDIDHGNSKSVSFKEIVSWKKLPNVKFFGFQEDIASIYSKTNIACLPSYREGLPKSLVEAAAAGRAIVTTDVPGCRDAIEPNKTGLLVPINNAMALADSIEYLLDNPGLRKRMGDAGRALAEKNFSINKIVNDHVKIFKHLLRKDKKINRKLLFVVNVDWFFLSHRLPIALEAIREGYEVHLATALTDKMKIIENYGLVVHPLSISRSDTGLWKMGKTFLEMIRVLKLVKPDVVHFVTIKPILIGGIAARLTRVPAVVSAISGLGFVFLDKGIRALIRLWMVKQLYRLALGHINIKAIFQNPNDLSFLSKLVELPDSKIKMIRGSGTNLSEYSSTKLPVGTPVVLMASRLLVDKGIREFVEAARVLRKRGIKEKNARFVVVGKPDIDNPHSLPHEELSEWRKEGIVEFWGYRTDMPNVMASSHLVVLPSYYGEGLPKVLIEAASCGRPVITTNHPGCRDAIEPGVTGLLVPVRDAKSLANAIEELLNDPFRCASFGKAGRRLAEKAFDEKKVVSEHLKIYNQLIHNSL